MSEFLAVGLMLLSILIGTPSSLFFKKSSVDLSIKNLRTIFALVKNKMMIIGLSLLLISFIPYFFALKQAQLSYLYPLVSISYIWTAILGYVFLKEKISKEKIVGISLIILGVIIVVTA
ncbi:EamA family transporter [Nanoarchaeota archaeon]